MDIDADLRSILGPAQGLPPSALPDPGDRTGDLATRSTSETRSILALASPRPQLPLPGMPDNLLSKPPPSLHPGSGDSPTLIRTIPHPGSPSMKTRGSKPGTPRPHNDDSTAGAVQRSPDGVRPLNVTDALSYLDAVKVQFQDKPEVYNHFLDIMKDFKSQVIDTPGVIQRVSRLFHGNPFLIQGFNTFLPHGYRIDISADPSDPNTITVTTPSGTTTQNTNNPAHFLRTGRESLGPPLLPFSGAVPSKPGSRSMTPHGLHIGHGTASFDPNFSPGFQNPQTTAAASFLGNLSNGNRNPVEKQPPGEFNHAIQYLNKIKAHYADDANTYKQFLDILQTYQKEQRHPQDSQVYVQVQLLFKDAPDLLAEFKDFLPEAVAGGSSQSGIVVMPQPHGGAPATPWGQLDVSATSPAEKSGRKPAQPLKRKKRAAEKDPTPVPPAKIAPNRTKKSKYAHPPDSGSPSFSPYVGPNSPPVSQAHASSHSGIPAPPYESTQPLSQFPPTSQSAASAVGFFDRARKSLDNREIYDEFLKVLNLYTKEVIDVKTLIEGTRIFLGDGDLMAEFKVVVGWNESRESLENGPPGSIRTGPPEALSALPADDGEGPSYRRLPDSEIKLACSGRDELCRSVLNDEWVSHPTWASEESGFVAHKKNSFEEALHKSEEERHEYHVHIEALTRTIAILEPLNVRIEEMTNEDRTLFKLKPDFGGSSKSIYHRIIKKVYGRDSGLEIIQALQDCPSVAVPVVLARLKQKDEEWRRAQREWSRTWREVDSKNFYKSLDHQGISFKANDKKNITAKHFVADIEMIKRIQMNVWEHDHIPSFARGSSAYQLEYAFHDTSVLMDSLKMVYSFLDRSQGQYSSQERRSVEKFLRAFIPLLCMYPVAEFNAACGPLEGIHDDDASHEVNGHIENQRSGRRSVGSVHSVQSSGIPASDLRKQLLRTAQEKSVAKDNRTSTSAVGSRAVTPASGYHSPNPIRADEESAGTKDIWIKEAGFADNTGFVPEPLRPFFANTTFYTLLRLLQILYSRLLMCKGIGMHLAANRHALLLANRVAVDLGLDDPNGPPAVLAQTMEVLGDRDDSNVVYMYLLNACEKLFDNDLDQATFEEHMRWFFGNKAYQLFTLDKLITALVKQVQTILADNKCQELWSLLQTAQNAEIITNQDIVRYRREAERHIGDDHLFKLQWVRELKSIRVHLMDLDDPSVDTDGSSRSRWREYINTYVMNHPTERLPTARKRSTPVFLRRTRLVEDSTASSDHNMRVRINPRTYRMVYEYGTEDVMLRVREEKEEEILRVRARARHEERKRSRWIWS